MSTLAVNALTDLSGNALYSARAWVNFNGTGTVAIRGSGNVSSITDQGTGQYVVNFTNAFSDTNYACVGSAHTTATTFGDRQLSVKPNTTSSCYAMSGVTASTTVYDAEFVQVAVFR